MNLYTFLQTLHHVIICSFHVTDLLPINLIRSKMFQLFLFSIRYFSNNFVAHSQLFWAVLVKFKMSLNSTIFHEIIKRLIWCVDMCNCQWNMGSQDFCILCVNVVRLTYTKEEKSCRVEPMCYGSPFLKHLNYFILWLWKVCTVPYLNCYLWYHLASFIQ